MESVLVEALAGGAFMITSKDQPFATYEKLSEGLRSLGFDPPPRAYYKATADEVRDRSRVLRRVSKEDR